MSSMWLRSSRHAAPLSGMWNSTEWSHAMRRYAFNIIAATSLTLCLATCGMWVRSYFDDDIFGHKSYFVNGFDDHYLISSQGRFGWSSYREEFRGTYAAE